ncbi:MAG: MauE/DoxX family redox-associated membrane protein, partial [Burkholderiales bacterium]
MILDPALYYLTVCVIALIFLHAGVSKLLARDEFRGVLANYRILPAPLLAPFALLLPFAELAAGAGVLWAMLRPYAAVLA